MNKLQQLYYIGITDFLDRIRSKSIILTTLILMYVTYLFFPAKDSTIYYTINFVYNHSLYRGEYNSLWLGWSSAIAFVSIITLFGYYLVNNSIKRERKLLIGEITASSGTGSWTFVSGKAFGNLLFLLVQVLAAILITVIMQFIRGDSYKVEIFRLLLPFAIYALPVCFIVAAIAVTSETIPHFPSSLANIIYFFIWTALLAASAATGGKNPYIDVFGVMDGAKVMHEQFITAVNDVAHISSFMLGNKGDSLADIKTFVMNDAIIRLENLLPRLLWMGAALILLLLASLMFRKSSLIESKPKKCSAKNASSIPAVSCSKPASRVLTPVKDTGNYTNIFAIVKSELGIIFSIPPKWWYIVTAGLSIAIIPTPAAVRNSLLIPILWVIPIFIWSRYSTMQRGSGMEACLFSYGSYRTLQLACSIFAMLLFVLILNTGVFIALAISGNIAGILCTLVAIFFVTILGIFIGTVTGSSSAFEIVYLILWYAGVLNNAPGMNFTATTPGMSTLGFLIAGLVLAIAAAAVKRIRIKTLFN